MTQAEDLGMLFQCGHVIVLPTRRGAFAVNRHDQIMTPALAMYGEYGEDELEVLSRFIKPGMAVLDVGAHIGTHSIPLSKMVSPGGAVLAFEPTLCTFNLLCANIAFSGQQNVYPHRMMVGDENASHAIGQIDMTKSANFGRINAHEAVKHANGKGIVVDEITIDSLELSACHLIKIDVEGSELKVLQGASETIARCSPVIQAECNEGADPTELLKFFSEREYQTYWVFNRLFRDNNYKHCTIKNEGSDRNILAVKNPTPEQTEGLNPCNQ